MLPERSALHAPHERRALTPSLRPYQRDAIDAVLAARRDGVRRMVVCLPTGAGKTVIFSHLARLARRQVLVLAHREELLTQAREKLERAIEGAAVVAIEQGAQQRARRREGARLLDPLAPRGAPRARHRGRDVGLVIYDECHHAAAEDNLRVLRQLGVFDDDWTGTLLGFTATTARGDGKGLDDVFERIVYTRTLPEMIDDGYLSATARIPDLDDSRSHAPVAQRRSTSTRTSSPRRSTSRSATRSSRARSRSSRATGAPSRSA